MNVLKSFRNRFDPGAAAVIVTTEHEGGEEQLSLFGDAGERKGAALKSCSVTGRLENN